MSTKLHRSVVCGRYESHIRVSVNAVQRHRHIYLCTNGMFIRKRLHEFQPVSRFFWNVHLDGMERTHDLCVERELMCTAWAIRPTILADGRGPGARGPLVCTPWLRWPQMRRDDRGAACGLSSKQDKETFIGEVTAER